MHARAAAVVREARPRHDVNVTRHRGGRSVPAGRLRVPREYAVRYTDLRSSSEGPTRDESDRRAICRSRSRLARRPHRRRSVRADGVDRRRPRSVTSTGTSDEDAGRPRRRMRASASGANPTRLPFGRHRAHRGGRGHAKFSTLVILRQNRFGASTSTRGSSTRRPGSRPTARSSTPCRGLPLYGHHATFGFYLFAPFYWLGFDGPTVMNVTQVLFLAAIPLVAYWLARRLGLQPWIARGRRVRVPGALLDDVVRAGALPPRGVRGSRPSSRRTRSSSGIRTTRTGRRCCSRSSGRKTSALAILGLGAVLFIQAHADDDRRRRRRGIYTFAFAAVWFALATQVLLPHFSPSGKAFYAEGFYGNLGNNFTSVAGSFVTHPSLVATHLQRAHAQLPPRSSGPRSHVRQPALTRHVADGHPAAPRQPAQREQLHVEPALPLRGATARREHAGLHARAASPARAMAHVRGGARAGRVARHRALVGRRAVHAEIRRRLLAAQPECRAGRHHARAFVDPGERLGQRVVPPRPAPLEPEADLLVPEPVAGTELGRQRRAPNATPRPCSGSWCSRATSATATRRC